MNLLQILKIHLKIKQIFICLLISHLFLGGFSSFAQKRTYTVVLDAGHGGKDPGNTGFNKKYKEKVISLAIVLQVGKSLEKRKDINIIYTRTSDVAVELKERPKIANKANADLFVSVHCNAHHTQASGTETFVLGVANNKRNFEIAKKENEVIFLEENHEEKYKGFNPNSPELAIGLSILQEEYLDQSVLLAGIIEKKFTSDLGRKSRGVKQASLWVMHQTAMPSVLIETGFLTNKSEGAYLNSNKGKSEMANAISKAIIEYIHGLKMNTVQTIEAPRIIEKKIVSSNSKAKVYFKIQIASGKSKISTASYNFKGLKEINRVKIGSYYKYYLGETTSYSKAKRYLSSAKKKGYKSAFIAAFRDGEKISLSEALK